MADATPTTDAASESESSRPPRLLPLPSFPRVRPSVRSFSAAAAVQLGLVGRPDVDRLRERGNIERERIEILHSQPLFLSVLLSLPSVRLTGLKGGWGLAGQLSSQNLGDEALTRYSESDCDLFCTIEGASRSRFILRIVQCSLLSE